MLLANSDKLVGVGQGTWRSWRWTFCLHYPHEFVPSRWHYYHELQHDYIRVLSNWLERYI